MIRLQHPKLFAWMTLAAIALPVGAQTEAIRLWRGEKRTCVIDGAVPADKAPAGFAVRTGVAREVRYLTNPSGKDYATLADRVVWGCEEPGVKVVEVEVAPGVKPGDYAIGDLKVTVVDRVLPPPSEWKYYLDLWQHPWAVARYFGVEPFSPAHYEKMRPFWRLLADAGGKTLTVTLLDLPWNHQCFDGYRTMIRHVKSADGTWKFDYRLFDEYVAFGRTCGLGRDIACYTMCPWDYGVTWEDANGKVCKARAVPGTPEFKEYWGDFLVDFAKHLKEKGWFESTYICMDERSPEDVRNICGFVQEKAPGLKTSLAGNQAPSKFGGIRIDNACFAIGNLTDALVAEASSRRAQGLITTFYVCCAPAHPNTLCACRLEESFWLGAYPAMVGLDGFLRWAWNSWPKDPLHDASFPGKWRSWPSGDTYLVYPDGSPTLRFLELRNGIVAAEKTRILKERGLFAEEFKALAAAYDRKAALDGKADFKDLRERTLKLVNRD